MQCNPGEGVQVYQPASTFAGRSAPHPNPLPARAGRGRSSRSPLKLILL
jgi:hypothetical protein